MNAEPTSLGPAASRLHRGLAGAVACAGALVALPSLAEPTFTLLHSFEGSQGSTPRAGLTMGAAGELYGADLGGIGAGSVYKLTPPASGQGEWAWSSVYAFPLNGTAHFPDSPLTMDAAGVLYGTGALGGFIDGVAASGAVFQLVPPASGAAAWSEVDLYNFTGRTAGGPDTPSGGALLRSPDGGWYGTSFYGGASNCGSVYKLSPPAVAGQPWAAAVIYSLDCRRDGSHPRAGLTADAAGRLYGTASEQGAGGGGVFRLTPPAAGSTAWTATTLYRFKGGVDGGFSSATLHVAADGSVYGTAELGGRYGRGVVFKLAPKAGGAGAWKYSVLRSFAGGSDGGKPRSGLVPDGAGGFYGATSGGGLGGRGILFQLRPPSVAGDDWPLTTLHVFAGPDGIGPFGDLLLRGGKLYGVTQGSQLGPGTAYSFEP